MTRQARPKTTTDNHVSSGFSHLLTVGAIPNRPNVRSYQARYKQERPANPRTPRLNDAESHGPEGATSKKVCTTSTAPTTAREIETAFASMLPAWWATLESLCLCRSTMQQVRDAVIVAGGLGTRMFPVSAIQPKETLPLIDVPLLTHLVMEAKNAGATRLHIILSPRKNLGDFLADRSDLASMRPELDETLFNITKDIEVFTHIQHEAKGIGNALQCALHAVEGPMLVLLGDNVLMDTHSPTTAFTPSTASKQLVEQFNQHGQATVGLMEVPEDQVSLYGIVSMTEDTITGMVEKPTLATAPSRMALCGRYVFPDTTEALLEEYSYERLGDLQTIALQEHLMNEGTHHGVLLDKMQWYDSGAPLSWLKAQVDHALRRPEYSEAMLNWLQERLND